jgi:transposase
MIPAPPGVRVLVWSAPVDFRAGMDRLAALVQVTLRRDPFAGDVFVRRPDRLKLLVYDGTGLVLVTKRLEAGRFMWPPASATSTQAASSPTIRSLGEYDAPSISTSTIRLSTR